eukprot:m.80565 g.80565  ORF g.80565 m.80565 type:complete len:102 (-) comp25322_c0_seq1:1801-2106(-)
MSMSMGVWVCVCVSVGVRGGGGVSAKDVRRGNQTEHQAHSVQGYHIDCHRPLVVDLALAAALVVVRVVVVALVVVVVLAGLAGLVVYMVGPRPMGLSAWFR